MLLKSSKICGSSLLLLVMTGTAFASPSVFWASDPIRPGETVMLLGDGFPDDCRVEFALVPRGKASRPPSPPQIQHGPWQALAPRQASDQSVKFVLPEKWPQAQYLCRIEGSTDQVTLNGPQVFWKQGDQGASSSPGGWLRLFGKNLDWGDQAQVGLQRGGKFVPLPMQERSPYALAAAVPQDLTPGEDCRVFIHNGLGGGSGWVNAGSIKIVCTSVPWPEQVFNILDYGAKPNDDSDDT